MGTVTSSRAFPWGIAVAVAVLCMMAGARESDGTVLSFEQLDWQDTVSQTPDSAWGMVTLDFTGYSGIRYFNLNVNGNWVVRNMGVDNLYGEGASQRVRTTFDLGVTDGTDVNSLQYVSSIGESPLGAMPTLSDPWCRASWPHFPTSAKR